MSFFLIIFALQFIASQATAVETKKDAALEAGASELFPGWPDYCCPLELQTMKYGDLLPDDAVTVEHPDGYQMAYVVDRNIGYNVSLKPEAFDAWPLKVYAENTCTPRADKQFFEVLVNPNQCQLYWYSTQYSNEHFINASGVFMERGYKYLPGISGFYFAKYFNRENGSFYPAVFKDGVVSGCVGEGSANGLKGHQVLAVDCLASLTSMAGAKMISIELLNSTLVHQLRSANSNESVEYFKRRFVNNSTKDQTQTVSFTLEKVNSVYVSLSESFYRSDCSAKSNSFAEQFSSKLDAYAGSGWLEKLFGADLEVNVDVSFAFQKAYEYASSSCASKSKAKNESTYHVERKSYSFSDSITVPAKTLTTVTAFSKQITGSIRYRSTYELSPYANNSRAAEVLYKALDRFKYGDKLEITDQHTILVHFDSSLALDAGYEVAVDVQSTAIA